MVGAGISTRQASHSPTFVGALSWLIAQIFSFEVLFTGYLYSNAYKQLLPILPIDETVLFAALCIPVGVFIVIRDGLYRPGINVVVATIVFFGWVIVTYAWTPSQILAKESISYLLTFGTIAVFGGAMVIANSRERTVRFLITLLFASLILAIYGSIIYLQHGSFRFYDGLVQRTYLLWGYAVTSGAIVAFTIAIYSRFGSSKQLIAGTAFVIMAFFLMIATSRGALLSAAGACLIPLLISKPIIKRDYFGLPSWLLMTLFLIFCLIIYSIYFIASGEMRGTFGRFVKLLNEAENPSLVFNANRFAYFAAAISQWLENPIFGGGVNSFTIYFYGREISGAIPHNLFLELLSQYGLVGFALFGVLTLTAFRYAGLERLRNDPLLLCVLMLFTSRLIGAMFGKDLPFQQPLLAFLALMVLRPPPPTSSPMPTPTSTPISTITAPHTQSKTMRGI